jgi:hypothetical protein
MPLRVTGETGAPAPGRACLSSPVPPQLRPTPATAIRVLPGVRFRALDARIGRFRTERFATDGGFEFIPRSDGASSWLRLLQAFRSGVDTAA